MGDKFDERKKKSLSAEEGTWTKLKGT